MGDIHPTTERQVRPLARLEPQQQFAAWQNAVETAPDAAKVTTAGRSTWRILESHSRVSE